MRARSPGAIHRKLFDGPPIDTAAPPIDIHEWKQLESQVSQLTSLALRAEDMERENARLREERDQARAFAASGEAAAGDAARAAQDVEALRRANESVTREAVDLRNALRDLESKNAALASDARSGELAMADARGLQDAMLQRDKENECLKQELGKLKVDMAHDIERLEGETARATSRLRAEADALRAELKQAQAECGNLNNGLQQCKNDKNAVMEQSMHDKDQLLATMRELEGQVVQLREMKGGAEQHAVGLQSRVAELEAHNVQALQQRDNNDALRRGEIKLLQEQLERCERERQASLEVQKEMQAMDEEMGVIHTRLTAKLKERDEAMCIAEQELHHLKSEHAAALEAQKGLQTRLRHGMEEREAAEAMLREELRRTKEQLTNAEEEVFRAQHRERTTIARSEEEMEQMAADLMRAEERARLLEKEKVEDATRYKEEMRRLEERLSAAERHCHELERTIDNGRDEMARAIEKHTHEMKDLEERLARDHDKAAKLISELEHRLASTTAEKDHNEAVFKETVDRLKEELRVAEEAVYRTERELFHQGEQHKEAAEAAARISADEARMRDGLQKDLSELTAHNQRLTAEKAELVDRLAAKERMLTDELHAVETAAKEEIRHLDEELRSVRRWAAEECYSAEEVAQLRDRVMATEANLDRMEQERRTQLDAAHHKLEAAEQEIRRLTREVGDARGDANSARAFIAHHQYAAPPPVV